MRFIKRNQQYKTTGMQPILPLVPERLESDNKDKTTFIAVDLKVCAGTGAGMPSYKKHMRTFDKGTPQEWMESLTGLRKIWQQNSVNSAHDRATTVAAVLKGDSWIAFEAAVEDAWTDPNAAALIPLTAEHVKESLCAVTTIVFPFALWKHRNSGWTSKWRSRLTSQPKWCQRRCPVSTTTFRPFRMETPIRNLQMRNLSNNSISHCPLPGERQWI
jgi:hypothetical protein